MLFLCQILRSSLSIFCSHLIDAGRSTAPPIFVVILSSSIKFLFVIYKYCIVKVNFKKYLLLVPLQY